MAKAQAIVNGRIADRPENSGTRAAESNHHRRAKRAIRELEHGSDSVVRVGGYVRTLAKIEASSGGVFSEALEARPEVEQWGSMAREVFGEFYGMGVDEVSDAEAPAGSGWMRKLIEESRALPEWQEAKRRSEGDSWATGLCSAATISSLQFDAPAPEKNAAALADQVEFLEGVMADEGMTSPGHMRRLAATKKALASAEAQDVAAVDAIASMATGLRAKIREALGPALEEVRQAQAGERGLGCGVGSGKGLKVVGPRSEVRAALRRNKKLARVAKLAGRLRATAAEKQRTRTQYAREEIADVTVGSDVGRLLPSELMMLGDEDTEALLFRKLLEGSALQYEVRGKEKLAEGPIVMALDESGSMAGARDEWAKACALALVEIAARQARPFALTHFDYSTKRIDVFEKPQNGLTIEQVEKMVDHFSGGGTSLTTALRDALALIDRLPAGKTLRKADIVLVTDGIDHDRAGIEGALRACSDAGIAVHAIAIGCDLPAWMKTAVASTTLMTNEDLTGSTEKVHTVFSI